MNNIIFEKTFVFNEVKFFTELLKSDNSMTDKEKKEMLESMNLENEDFEFKYQKDSKGSWFMHCYKGEQRISWDDIENWMRQHVWDFEKENRMFFN